MTVFALKVAGPGCNSSPDPFETATCAAGDECPAPTCGDGACNEVESCATCPEDCGDCVTRCGNGTCDLDETCSSCASDCGACAPTCGNDDCESAESCASCPDDCGPCTPVCGDGRCEAEESCCSCPGDCGSCSPVCNDGDCQINESCATCMLDCGTCSSTCGNGSCELGETCVTCAGDCGGCAALDPVDKERVLAAARYVRESYPQFFVSEDRAIAYEMMTAVIRDVRARGADAHRCLAHRNMAPSNPYRWCSDALVIGPPGRGITIDVYRAWPDPATPQLLITGEGTTGELTCDLLDP